MGSLILACVIALVGLAVLLLRRPPPTDFLMSALPFALMLPIVPLGPCGLSFIRAFQETATMDQGGTRFIAGICLSNSRPLYYGLLGSLLMILLAAAAQIVSRNRSATGLPSVSRMPGWALTVAGWALALVAGFLSHQARQLAFLTMFAVDPEKNAEAETVFKGMDLSGVSNIIATKAILVTGGGFALSLLLLGAGVFNTLMAPSIVASRRARIGAWCLFVVVLASGGLQAAWLGVDLRWFESVLNRP